MKQKIDSLANAEKCPYKVSREFLRMRLIRHLLLACPYSGSVAPKKAKEISTSFAGAK